MERATRYSRKREAILNAIQSTDCHPSAEWVYQTLKPTHPDLSLGTVYRNLNLLVETGEIKKLTCGDGADHFDGDIRQHGVPPLVAVPYFVDRCFQFIISCGVQQPFLRIFPA